jgi:hypothetical protein
VPIWKRKQISAIVERECNEQITNEGETDCIAMHLLSAVLLLRDTHKRALRMHEAKVKINVCVRAKAIDFCAERKKQSQMQRVGLFRRRVHL